MSKENMTSINCAKCTKRVCGSAAYMKGPDNCPTKIRSDLIKSKVNKYHSPEFNEFARMASIIESNSFTRVDWSDAPVPQTTRLEEIIRFCFNMGYKKLGVAFCAGLANEASLLIPILENSGFEVISVCCKVGGIAKEEIGIKDTEKICPGEHESMCNPIVQAEILNNEKCDFNIMMGLCVGHDSLFIKHAEALTTVFAVKDRLLGHNPLAAIYLSSSYYRYLRSPKMAKNKRK